MLVGISLENDYVWCRGTGVQQEVGIVLVHLLLVVVLVCYWLGIY